MMKFINSNKGQEVVENHDQQSPKGPRHIEEDVCHPSIRTTDSRYQNQTWTKSMQLFEQTNYMKCNIKIYWTAEIAK